MLNKRSSKSKMNKIESYVTPIILNEVSKYVKNFQAEDFQMSLWEGEATFQNLELRSDCLEDQLNLPFELLSGHIREFTVKIPWSKITSQPITMVLNTIQLNLKLKDRTTNTLQKKKETQETALKTEQPQQGYIAGLANKIINNINVICENIILKVFADNIVLSVNIGKALLSSANSKWKESLSDLNPMRKILHVLDFSLCVDSTNKSGHIGVRFEPVLNKCSAEVRIFQKSESTNSTSSTLMLHIFSKSLDINISSLQYPIIISFINSLKAVKPDFFKSLHNMSIIHEIQTNAGGIFNWIHPYLSWAWNQIPNIFPSTPDEEEEEEQEQNTDGQYIDLGLYIEELKFTIKSSTIVSKYLRVHPILSIYLKGLFWELLLSPLKWINVQAGVSSILIKPAGKYNPRTSCYFILTESDWSESYLHDSLFKNVSEDKKQTGKKYTTDLQSHLLKYSDSYLLSKGSALAIDIVHIPKKSSTKKSTESDSAPSKFLLRVLFSTVKISSNTALSTVISTLNEIFRSYGSERLNESSLTQHPKTFHLPKGDLEIILSKILIDFETTRNEKPGCADTLGEKEKRKQ